MGKVVTLRLRPALASLRLTRVVWAVLLLQLLGCGPSPDTSPPRAITYTFDAPTRELIHLLAEKIKSPVYRDFDRNFKGILVPESLLPFE
ncbi:MAG: hypothetical protein Q8L00_08885, partial [Deltaproteobacteria bacterium]|nr:hypothetical protein [Deltaproteobacteria bacterium]